MDIYLKLIDVIVPVFALIGIGYYLGKTNPKFDTQFITYFAAKLVINFVSYVGSFLPK